MLCSQVAGLLSFVSLTKPLRVTTQRRKGLLGLIVLEVPSWSAGSIALDLWQGRTVMEEGCGRGQLLTLWKPGRERKGESTRGRGQGPNLIPKFMSP